MNEHDDGVEYAQMNSVLRFALATLSMKQSACGYSDTSTQPEPNYDPEPTFTPTKAAPQIQQKANAVEPDEYVAMDALLDALQICLECMQETRATSSQYGGEVPASEHDDVLRMLSEYLLHSDARDVMLRALIGELVSCDESGDEDHSFLACISKSCEQIRDSLLVALTEMQEQELPDCAATRWVAQTIEEIQSLLGMLHANDHSDTSDSPAFNVV
ncbi:hypothetical protein FI667_g14522, partial [Globisporangium splendens]